MGRAPSIRVDRVTKVFDDGNHNAFTDLCRFAGRYYLTFRSCPDGHMLFESSRVVVQSSADTEVWTPVFDFAVPGRDVRDPHFLVFQDRLFVYPGTWLVGEEAPSRGDPNDMKGYAAWTANGSEWQGPQAMAGTEGHYVWRAASFGDSAYLCGRRRRGLAPTVTPEDREAGIEAALMRSDDGLSWESVGLFRESYGNETAFLFEQDGAIVAIHRGRGSVPAEVCRAESPYRVWTRRGLGLNVGGPMLARWEGRLLVGGRNYADPKNPKTSLWWLDDDDTLVEALSLPSGGDTSYPGFIDLGDGRAIVSYYSSHEGSGMSLAPSAIYLARISLD